MEDRVNAFGRTVEDLFEPEGNLLHLLDKRTFIF